MKKLVTAFSKRLLLLCIAIGVSALFSATVFAAGKVVDFGTITSQTFAKNQAATAVAPTIIIIDDTTTATITAANDIKLRIPAGATNVVWDSTDTTITMNGAEITKITKSTGGACAGAPCTVTVTYADSDKTMIIPVETNFVAGNSVSVETLTATMKTFTAEFDDIGLGISTDADTTEDANCGTGAQACNTQTLTGGENIDVGAATIASAAAQKFATNQASVANSTITLTDDAASIVINTVDDIRITIPSGSNFIWDSTDTTATFGGTASAKAGAITYEDSDRTLVIAVTTDFTVGQTLTIADLKFKTFSARSAGTDNLDLDVANDNTIVNVDTAAISVSTPTILSSAAQQFTTGMNTQPLDWTITITEDASVQVINATDNLRIKIPSTFNMNFDPSDTSITASGTGLAAVGVSAGGIACGVDPCTVTLVGSDYKQVDGTTACTAAAGDCRTLIVPIVAAPTAGQTITITGASLFNFSSASVADNLELEVVASTIYGTAAVDEDNVTMTIVVGSSTANKDKTGPSAPTDFAVSDQGVLTWTDPTATDLKEIQILKGTGIDPVNGTPVAVVAKGLGTYTDASVVVGQTVKYILRAKDTSNNYSANTDTVTAVIAPPPVEVEPIESVTVNLTAVGESGQSGTATLTEADGAVTVEVVVNDPDTDTVGTTQQAHIHSGICAETGDVAHALTDLVDGVSTTVLEITLAELALEGASCMKVHDAIDPTVIVATGEVYAAATPTPEEVAAPEETVEELTSETGTIVEETTLKGANESAYITFSADTTLTTAEGTPFIGTFMSPTLQVGALDGVTPPAGAAFASDVYRFGSEEGTINASKPGTAYFPAGEGYEIDIVNEEYQAFKLGSDEPSATCSVVTSEGATLFRCELTSFSDYVILAFAAPEEEEETGAEEEEEEEEEVAEAPFTDTKTHWSKDYVTDLYAKGIVSGKTTTKYAPDDAVTRAEFTKIIVGAFGIDMVSTTGSFTDISGHWGSKYIEAAKAAGVISGYSDKTFKPDAQISRAEALKILLEAADVSLTAAAANFSDVKASDWFAKYVNYAAANVIVKGYADGTFGPNKSITRGEVAKIVSLMIAE